MLKQSYLSKYSHFADDIINNSLIFLDLAPGLYYSIQEFQEGAKYHLFTTIQISLSESKMAMTGNNNLKIILFYNAENKLFRACTVFKIIQQRGGGENGNQLYTPICVFVDYYAMLMNDWEETSFLCVDNRS